MFDLYVIGIDMFNLHKNACSMFWLWPIFLGYSNQESENRLMFLKKGVGV